MNLQDLILKLKKSGYSINIPFGSNKIRVNGYNNEFFSGKKQKLKPMLNQLIRQGYNAKMEKHEDGYYDIFVSINDTEKSKKRKRMKMAAAAAASALALMNF